MAAVLSAWTYPSMMGSPGGKPTCTPRPANGHGGRGRLPSTSSRDRCASPRAPGTTPAPFSPNRLRPCGIRADTATTPGPASHSASAAESLLDGGVLLLPDVHDEVQGHQRFGWAIELQLDERLALGEQHHRHSLGAVR